VTAQERYVDGLYQALLQRPAEAGGLLGWSSFLAQGGSRAQLVQGVVTGPEYQTNLVQGQYGLLLHRSAEPAGLNGFSDFLAGGGTAEQAEALIAGSPEYFASRGGGTNQGFLTALYHDALGRDVEPAALSGFLQGLAGGSTPGQVAAQVFSSPEFRQDQVQNFYQTFLHRAADGNEVSGWSKALLGGARDEDVIAGFLTSPEFSDRATAVGTTSDHLTFLVAPDSQREGPITISCPPLQPTLAGQLLNQALQSFGTVPALAGSTDVQAELSLAGQALQQGAGLLSAGDGEGALAPLQQASSLLHDVLQNPRGESQDLQNAVAAVATRLDQTISALEGCTTPTVIGWGLDTVTFAVPQGQITVNLPADLAAGDTISGTVVAAPAGQTPDEQASNQTELNGYFLAVDQQRTAVGKGVLNWAVAARLGGSLTPLVLRDQDGREVGRAVVPVRPPVSQPGLDFQLPRIGQAGKPIEIDGPFDGDFSTTSLQLSGQQARMLAESPRELVAASPPDMVGPVPIELQEGGARPQGGQLNLLRLTLTALRTTLSQGETTLLTVQVEGLQGLASDVQLVLRNQTPDAVQMEGGNTRLFVIRPEDVQPDGTVVVAVHLTGLQGGIFDVQAAAIAPTVTWVEDPNHPGITVHTGKVDTTTQKGTITVRTDVTMTGQRDNENWIAITYTGADSNCCCWIQFLWSELIIYKGDQSAWKAGTEHSTTGDYPLTTDPAHPQWHVDSTSATDPCDDENGGISRTDGSITLYDRPGPNFSALDGERSDPAVTRIVSIDHFDDFLVCDGQVVSEFSWSSTYVWTPAQGTTGPYYLDSALPPRAMNQAQQDQLNKQYPGQTAVK
jgi:hypothetical protein